MLWEIASDPVIVISSRPLCIHHWKLCHMDCIGWCKVFCWANQNKESYSFNRSNLEMVFNCCKKFCIVVYMGKALHFLLALISLAFSLVSPHNMLYRFADIYDPSADRSPLWAFGNRTNESACRWKPCFSVVSRLGSWTYLPQNMDSTGELLHFYSVNNVLVFLT